MLVLVVLLKTLDYDEATSIQNRLRRYCLSAIVDMDCLQYIVLVILLMDVLALIKACQTIPDTDKC